MSKPNQSVDELLRDLRAGKNDNLQVTPEGTLMKAPAGGVETTPGPAPAVKTREVTFA